MAERIPRRALLAGAAALALGSAGPAAARGRDEGDALTALVRAEEDAAYVYRTARLGGLAAALAEQDAERARALATQLEALALPIPGATRDRDGLPAAALAVLDARGDGALRAAADYEQTLIDGCADALPLLEEPNTVRTVATVLAGHAQHQALIRREAGGDALSSAG
jgi:hypothetical protein